jgi:hypothetical protein
MKTSIAKVILSLTCMLGLTACGGLIKVQRAVEAKGYEVEKVGVSSATGKGRVLTVYTEKELDSAQKQEVADTAAGVYRKDATVEVKKGDGSGVGTSSSGGSKSSKPSGPKTKPNK